jgi:hypothetical protein
VDDKFDCFVLERPVRDHKIYGETAIPAGRYHIALTFSPHFGHILPLIEHVPNFDGVRIHAGNRAPDSKGCLLVGRTRGQDCVGESQLALRALMEKMRLDADIWLTIIPSEAAK